jgi:hypothetical protein
MRNENPVSMANGGIKKGVATHCILLSREPFLLSREPIYMALLRGGCNVLQLGANIYGSLERRMQCVATPFFIPVYIANECFAQL